ncbi:hypothetical protein Cha6605_2680 [Chamaesiphon minutus PCC 6605]|uniref:Uncharacterized protein n=2 Tax=Chamaesiphon TaxID=217161 RepID=K9UF24_CHAP6|nr:hypothetical protein Cha6605_2680 [Chamaesiphon minutus PCC 6605]
MRCIFGRWLRQPEVIARTLADRQDVPDWLLDLEYINWHGMYKDLSFIPQGIIDRTILIDDRVEYIHPDQKERWLNISGYEYPYPDDDRKLDRFIEKLSQINRSQNNRSS